ncbi:MAG TPA: ComF family protein [Candidatus Binatia bacterium]|nr:ComF family protein [Candidatus Binatia bacterium]
MRRWIALGLDVLLPRSCVTCDQVLPAGTSSPLCAACRAAIVAPGVAMCHSPAFTSARSLGPYRPGDPRDVLARAVQRLKYHGDRSLAEPLAELLAAHYPFPDAALVVPVPLHLSRLRARGYNQALLLARGLARRRGLACGSRLLVRTRATVEHATLGAEARRANVRGAFRLRPGMILRHAIVVLVDDVLTTGATADACARILYAAGARQVHVYTVGRTP